MTLEDVIEASAIIGVELTESNGKLVANGPQACIEHLRPHIKRHKEAIVERFRREREEYGSAADLVPRPDRPGELWDPSFAEDIIAWEKWEANCPWPEADTPATDEG